MIAVTKLINILDKPALKYWANKIGLEGVDIRNYEKNVKDDGNTKHINVEKYLKDGTVFDGCELFEQSISGYDVIGVESDINNGFITGRVDLILRKYDDVYVVDLKRNNNIYLSTKLQLSTYKHILKADKIAYMNLKTFELIVLNIDTLKYYNIVKRLYQISKLLDELKERL